jgi:hypothetical protein
MQRTPAVTGVLLWQRDAQTAQMGAAVAQQAMPYLCDLKPPAS